MGAKFTITDIEGDQLVNLQVSAEYATVENNNSAIREIIFPKGWYKFHINAPKDTIKPHNYSTGITSSPANININTIFYAGLHTIDNIPITTNEDIQEYVAIIKHNDGTAWLPQYAFNGIGEIEDFQGYTIKTYQPCKLVYVGDNHIIPSGDYQNYVGGIVPLASGWNTIGFPLLNGTYSPISQILAPIDSSIVIVKDYLGNAYLPEWGFDGIGAAFPDRGYQIKTTESVNLTVQHQQYSGILDFSGFVTDPADTVDDIVVTDSSTVVSFLNDEFLELIFTHNFGTSPIKPLNNSVSVLAIKEKILLEAGILSVPVNVFEERKLYNIIASGGLKGYIATKEQEALELIENIKQDTKATGPNNKAGTKNGIIEYPYYYSPAVVTLQGEWKAYIERQAFPYNHIKELYLGLLRDINVRAYITFTTDSGLTFGSSELFTWANNYIIKGVLYGDDPLEAGTNGFAAHEDYNCVLCIEDKSNIYNNIMKQELSVTYNAAASVISNADKLGKFEDRGR